MCREQIVTKNFRICQSIPVSAASLPGYFLTNKEGPVAKFERLKKFKEKKNLRCVC
jgi:hypothetical protein